MKPDSTQCITIIRKPNCQPWVNLVSFKSLQLTWAPRNKFQHERIHTIHTKMVLYLFLLHLDSSTRVSSNVSLVYPEAPSSVRIRSVSAAPFFLLACLALKAFFVFYYQGAVTMSFICCNTRSKNRVGDVILPLNIIMTAEISAFKQLMQFFVSCAFEEMFNKNVHQYQGHFNVSCGL